MLGREGGRFVDRLEPLVDPLARQPHHQVEADVVEAGRPRLAERRAGPLGAVQPRQAPEFIVPERLDTEAEPVDAGARETLEPRGRDRFGIRLERDLAVGGDVEARSQASMMRAISSGSSSEGVPPPK